MEDLEFGGKKFKLAGESTARHDIWTMRQIAACGLNVVSQIAGETEEQFMYRLYLTALKTGDIFLLLGSLVIPFDADPLAWTPAMATETAEFLAALTQEKDKAGLRILLASALMPFFLGGQRSSATSPKSLTLHSPGEEQPPIGSAEAKSTEIGG